MKIVFVPHFGTNNLYLYVVVDMVVAGVVLGGCALWLADVGDCWCCSCR